MNISDFDFDFPAELIARYPSEIRGESKLLIAHRKSQEIIHTTFSQIHHFLEADDCLVVNQSRVFPARLIGQKETGRHSPQGRPLQGRTELLLLKNVSKDRWRCLAFPLKRLRPGVRVFFSAGIGQSGLTGAENAEGKKYLLSAKVIDIEEGRDVLVDFSYEGEFQNLLDKVGHIPLPPYLGRQDEPIDRERYQTIFAKDTGAVAAPTAGLHWTERLLEEVSAAGIEVVPITLHVGRGTFLPIREEEIENHKMHDEYFEISQDVAKKINAAKRVVAVGTTVVRALESAAKNGEVAAMSGFTDLFIYPGYSFQVVDLLQTNFHRPKSSLFAMVSALGGIDFMKRCYEEAIKQNYRLFSYGDTMLIL